MRLWRERRAKNDANHRPALWRTACAGLLLLACAKEPPPPAAAPAPPPELRLLGLRGVVLPSPGAACGAGTPLLDAEPRLTVRLAPPETACAALTGSVRAADGCEGPAMAIATEPRGEARLGRWAPGALPAGGRLVLRCGGQIVRTFDYIIEAPPEARPAVAAVRTAGANEAPAALAERFESAARASALASPPTPPTGEDTLALEAEAARAWQRVDAHRASAVWRASADRAAALGRPTEAARRLRAAAYNALSERAYGAALDLLDRAHAAAAGCDDAAGDVRERALRGLVLRDRGELRAAAETLTAAVDDAFALGLDADQASASQSLALVLDTLGLHAAARATLERVAPYYAAHPEDRDGGPRFEANLGTILFRGVRAGAFPRAEALPEARRRLAAALAGFRARNDTLAADDPRATLAALELAEGRLAAATEVLWSGAIGTSAPRPPGGVPASRRGYSALALALAGAELALAQGGKAEAARAEAAFRDVEARAVALSSQAASPLAIQARFGAARAALAAGRGAVADADLAVAQERLDTLAGRSGAMTGAGAVLADRRAIYTVAFERARARGDAAGAAAIAERARAATLRALSAEARVEALPPQVRTERAARLEAWSRARSAYEASILDEDLTSVEALPALRAARAAEGLRLSRELAAIDALSAPAPAAPAPTSALRAGEVALSFFEASGGPVAILQTPDGAALLADGAAADGTLPAALLPALTAARHVYLVTGGHEAARRTLAKNLAALVPVTLLPALALLPAAEASGLDGPPLLALDPEGNLPHARAERQAVRAAFPPEVPLDALEGEAATRAALVAAWSGRRLLHFAGHGTLLRAEPWQARLRLAHGEALTLPDILALRPRLGLVVLSGCETGEAAELTGLESLGLADAFLAAGARTVVAAIERVDDADTAAFIAALYARGGAQRPAEIWRALLTDDDPALRRAAAPFRVFGRPAGP